MWNHVQLYIYTNNIYNVEINKRLLNMSDWVGFERFSVGLVHGRLGQLEYLNPLQTCEKTCMSANIAILDFYLNIDVGTYTINGASEIWYKTV